MSLIIGDHIGLSFGDQKVLRNVSFRLADGDRVALVGPNGEGKTTLLRIIAGQLESTAGDLHRKRGLRVGYLPQDPPALSGTTVRGAMLDIFADLRRMETELRDIEARLAHHPQLVDRYGTMQHEFEALGGYDYSLRIEQVLSGLAFDPGMQDRPLADLSGGERTRAYLATLLLTQPDVLLLDEPTNHLDMQSTEWLEHWLQSSASAMIIVSHDRYLLDHTTDRTWEIGFRRLESYRGAYTKYLTLRTARHAERQREWDAQQQYIRKTEEFIRIHIAGQRSREAQGRRKRLERFLRDEAIEKPRSHRTIHLHLAPQRRTGDVVLTAAHLQLGYPPAKPLLTAEEIELFRGQRVAIVGPNGAGKTTLLRTLLGQIDPLAGDFRLGANVDIGYLSQTHAELDEQAVAADLVQAAAGDLNDKRARSLLGSLLLSGDDAFKRIAELSGGQRSRVALARLIVCQANVLFLDEPTNHLDIPSTEVIQEALLQFDGTILFVSHDRYLIQAIATHVWAVHHGKLNCLTGGWNRYLQWRDEQAGPPHQQGATSKQQRRTAYKESRQQASEQRRLRRKHEQLEAKIQMLEQAVARLNHAISNAADAGQVDLIRQLSLEHQEKTARLKTLWNQWEDVGSRLEE